MGKLNLQGISFDAYKALDTKDNDTMYFITDKHCIYVRGALYSGRIEMVSQNPTSPEIGVVYIDTTTLEAKSWTGTGWNVLSKGFTTVISDTSDDTLIPTSKAVATYVTNKVAGVVGGSGTFVTAVSATGNGELKVDKGDVSNNVPLTNMVYSPTWNQSTKQLTLPVVGGTTLTLDLSKDLVVTNGKYNNDTQEIWLTIAEDGTYTDEDKLIKIPVGTLVDIYTGKSTNTANVTINGGNEISVDVKISTKEGNALEVDTENGGLYVNVPDDTTKVDKVGTGHSGELLTANAEGGMQLSGKTIGGNTIAATPNGNTIATEVAVKTYADGVAQNAVTTAASDATTKANAAESNARAYANTLITWNGW